MDAYDVFKISEVAETNRLKIELAAATEIDFEIDLEGLDYNQVLADICQVAVPLMRADVDVMEMCDGSDVRPRPEDLQAIRQFRRKYQSHLYNVMTDLFGY